jgi:hypothetical protein
VIAAFASAAHGGFDWSSLLWVPLAILGGLMLLALLAVIVIATFVPAGIFAGVKGGINAGQSREIKKQAQKKLDEAVAKMEAAHSATQERVAEFNLQKIKIVTGAIGRFADWMERSHLNINRLAHDGADVALIQAVQELPQFQMSSDEIAAVVLKASAGAAARA